MVLYESANSDGCHFSVTIRLNSWALPLKVGFCHSDYDPVFDVPGMSSTSISVLCVEFQWLQFFWKDEKCA
jgi:hypothetical protein